jgi:hypothetical protein
MKKIACMLVLLLIASASAFATPVSFTIREREYLFSNYFEFAADKQPMGLVIKKRYAYLHLTNNYDLYTTKGDWQARGVSRLFCLGALYSWATEIDVYDTNGVRIGLIDGQAVTTAAARFSIYEYDSEGNSTLKAIAFMDDERRSFSIVHPENDKQFVASLQRVFLPNLRDHWECNAFDADLLDIRILKVFSAFAVDHQEFFRADN